MRNNVQIWCWVIVVSSSSTAKALISTDPAPTDMTHRCPKSQTFMHTNKRELVANSVCALTERWKSVSCHPAPGHVTVVMTVILVITRKRRSWNWGVNQSETNKSRRTGRRLMWTVAQAEGGRHWKDCGGPDHQQLGLTDTTRAHAYVTRLCCTTFSPWLQFGQTYLRQVSQCPSDAAFIFTSISIQEKPIFISNCIFYISCTVENIYAVFELGHMPDFRALTKGWILEIRSKTRFLMVIFAASAECYCLLLKPFWWTDYCYRFQGNNHCMVHAVPACLGERKKKF